MKISLQNLFCGCLGRRGTREPSQETPKVSTVESVREPSEARFVYRYRSQETLKVSTVESQETQAPRAWSSFWRSLAGWFKTCIPAPPEGKRAGSKAALEHATELYKRAQLLAQGGLHDREACQILRDLTTLFCDGALGADADPQLREVICRAWLLWGEILKDQNARAADTCFSTVTLICGTSTDPTLSDFGAQAKESQRLLQVRFPDLFKVE